MPCGLAPLHLPGFCYHGRRSICARVDELSGRLSWRLLATNHDFREGGWSKEGLAAARQFAETDSIHTSAVMIVKGGEVVDQWGDFDKKIDCYSIRKSLLSALYGIYSAEGVIDVNQTLEQIGIDDSPDPLTKEEKQARVVDLLRARSGVYHAVDFETESMQKSRPARGSHAPGTFWYYNNWDFNVLGTIFGKKKTGLKLGDAFYQRVAKPIGMEDFQPSDVFYFGGPLSIHPAYHFEITARDMARFGLLYLRHGRWNGKQIVREAWIEKSSHANEMVKSDGAITAVTSIFGGWTTAVFISLKSRFPGSIPRGETGLITFSSFRPWTWSSCIARTTILRSRMPRPLRKLRTERRQPARTGHNSVI